MKNIIVIYGGKSVEHDISILTAIQTIKNINKDKYNVIPVYQTRYNKFISPKNYLDPKEYANTIKKLKKVKFNFGESSITLIGCSKKTLKIDCAINCCHGNNGEDGTITALMNLCNIPLTSCSILASSACMDKIVMKDIFKANNIPCVDYIGIKQADYINNPQETISQIIKTLDYPVIVKPSNLGSSIGIEKATNQQELEDALDIAFYYDSRVIVEKCLIDFKEINISCLGNDDCELSELEQPTNWKDFLNFKDKYQNKDINSKIFNPNLSNQVKKQIQDLAQKVFKIFDLSGVIRIDFMVKDDNVYVNEINTIPGSLAYYLWKSKYEFFQLIDKLIELAIQKYNFQNMHKYTFNSNVLLEYKENNICKYAK